MTELIDFAYILGNYTNHAAASAYFILFIAVRVTFFQSYSVWWQIDYNFGGGGGGVVCVRAGTFTFILSGYLTPPALTLLSLKNYWNCASVDQLIVQPRVNGSDRVTARRSQTILKSVKLALDSATMAVPFGLNKKRESKKKRYASFNKIKSINHSARAFTDATYIHTRRCFRCIHKNLAPGRHDHRRLTTITTKADRALAGCIMRAYVRDVTRPSLSVTLQFDMLHENWQRRGIIICGNAPPPPSLSAASKPLWRAERINDRSYLVYE